MDSNQKQFNIYVFLSSFARNLIEVFIPIILYKYGYTVKEVLFYTLFINVFSLILMFPCMKISKTYNNKILSFIGIVSFIIMQLLLNNLQYSYSYLLMISFLFALYRRAYWMARRFYNLKVIHKKNISKDYSIISIVNQLGVILSAYLGSLLLDFVSLSVLTIISIILFVISIIPLYLLKFKHENSNTKIELFKTIKNIPKSNAYLFGTYELINILKILFALYLFIYVKNNYQTIGIFNLVANLATILFTYIYGKQINTDKNFLKLSIFLTVLVYIAKVNCNSSLLILIAFFEGICTKMYELSISKHFYQLSKKFEYYNYNLAYETFQNFFRTAISLILYLFISDLKIMIYIVLLFIMIGMFLSFKDIKVDDYDVN